MNDEGSSVTCNSQREAIKRNKCVWARYFNTSKWCFGTSPPAPAANAYSDAWIARVKKKGMSAFFAFCLQHQHLRQLDIRCTVFVTHL